MANIFKAAKGFLKEDLLFVAEEIGDIFPEKVKISELKDIILKSKEYLDGPDFVTNILVTTVSERKLKEEFEKAERLKQLKYEESGKIRIHELEVARIMTTHWQFLAETEGEEIINLVRAGFSLGVDENRQSFQKKVRYFPKEKIPTASKEVKKECVFCTGKHSSRDCFQTQKMSLAERHNILREKQCCFACLTPKHTARSCKTYLRCVICSKKHVPLMCESLKAKNQDSFRSENKGSKVEVNMANNTSSPRVFLQTLQLKMVCGTKEIPVRAILDSGSQKSYVLKNVVEKMGYIPLRREILMHSLFWGIKSDNYEHTCYGIRLRNQDNSVTCNL
ncbi:DUF1758 domain-containing protein [Trichonephila clavipes]|uniref:DUF1758 domain-containing protein n=1 Tax=Trichonephila clavipes TaxID=2585209 RepID=A0A8X6VUF9_TRICX|nr:DUF1758 domain-containing protein [Trichonephila clavipes]